MEGGTWETAQVGAVWSIGHVECSNRHQVLEDDRREGGSRGEGSAGSEVEREVVGLDLESRATFI